MTFEIIANNLARKAEIKSLRLRNAEYEVVLFYMGDYENDRKNGRCDYPNVSMRCKPQKGNLPFCLLGKEVMVELPEGLMLRPQEIEIYKELLDIAGEAAEEVQRLLKEYFDVEPDC